MDLSCVVPIQSLKASVLVLQGITNLVRLAFLFNLVGRLDRRLIKLRARGKVFRARDRLHCLQIGINVSVAHVASVELELRLFVVEFILFELLETFLRSIRFGKLIERHLLGIVAKKGFCEVVFNLRIELVTAHLNHLTA